jgi:hypothetical protein
MAQRGHFVNIFAVSQAAGPSMHPLDRQRDALADAHA